MRPSGDNSRQSVKTIDSMYTEAMENAALTAPFDDILQDIIKIGVVKALRNQSVTAWSFYEFLKNNPLASEAYSRVLEYRTELLVDEVIEIADTEPCPQTARNRIDARRWYASKMRPSKYSDRIDVNITETVDIRSALAEANARRMLRPCYNELPPAKQVIELTAQNKQNTSDYKSVEQPLSHDVDPFS